MVAMSLFSTFSQITWEKEGPCQLLRSGYLRLRQAAAAAAAAAVSAAAASIIAEGRGGSMLRCRVFVVERTYWDTVKILLANTLGLSLALLEGVFVLELGSHFGGSR